MKFSELRLPARAGIVQGIGNVIIKLFSFASTGIFTRLILPNEYGTYALYTSYLAIFTVMLTLEMHGTVFYGTLQRFGDTKKSLASAYGLFCAVFVPFALILFLLLPYSSLPRELIPVLIAQIFVDTTITFFLSKYRTYAPSLLNQKAL